ncbi:MAG: hypothetical protein IRZ16_08535 [Myxococcaceae bacterium]|nr:hypothetical protein [Myxococcaceae bacterium]
MARRSPTLWIAACAGAALLLAAVVVGLSSLHRPALPRGETSRPVAEAHADAGAAAGCTVALPSLRRAEPFAENPPVILWAVGDVRLFLDGKPAFSPPEAPKRFPPGSHEVRVEAPGREPITATLRFSPYQPVLIHAEDDGDAGLTLVQVGAVCTSCEPPVVPLDSFPVPKKARPKAAPDALLQSAAAALRTSRWQEAALALGALPPKARTGTLYHRLAAATWTGAVAFQKARAELSTITGPDANELDRLLARLAALAAEEQTRNARVVMARWNRVTEQHAALLRSANGIPGLDLAGSERRMVKLSGDFNAAAARKDVAEQERIFAAAEEVAQTLLSELIAARKDDCALRARVATALAGEAP